ncbi:hypothetical protein E3V39_02465 [Gammaproteobacteria bacterium LSUCC0112]|nr:hypothetical protein E3V39_02465 [Gammaproteobacteria bacterium LSUCC0112]
MRRRSKELNIFSMSALDLFASAMGAFILITLILFPFFPNTGDSPERIRDVRADLEQQMQQMAEAQAQAMAAMQAQLAEAEAQAQASQNALSTLQGSLSQCQATLEQATQQLNATNETLQNCRTALQQTFVLVVISWSSDDDVDLHVTDPAGSEYYYQARTFPGSDAALEEDTVNGPGNEIWLSPSAMPGRYEIDANLYANNSGGAVAVRGSLLYQNGRMPLPDLTLSGDGDRRLITAFTVDNEGNVTFN